MWREILRRWLRASASPSTSSCFVTRAQDVNRASSVIYGNLLVVLITAQVGLAALPRISATDAGSVVFLGVFQIGVAYTFFTLGMARGVRSLDAGIAGYIEPVLNPVWVFLVLGERPSAWALVGGCIIIAAVVTHTVRGARSRARQRALIQPSALTDSD